MHILLDCDILLICYLFFFSSRRRHTRWPRDWSSDVCSSDLALLDLAHYVEQTVLRLLEEYKPGRKLYANVEFYAAAVLKAVEMPKILFTPTYTVSRMVGWTTNILEQSRSSQLFKTL